MKVLDLFSGLGGASEAFLKAGHEVLRIENNPLLGEIPNTETMCVFELRDFLVENHAIQNGDKKQIDLIWASPPCDEFSLGYNAPYAIHTRENPNEPYQPNLEPLPLIDPPRYPTKAEIDKRHSGIRKNIRAKIPIEISEALLFAIQSQKSILDF